jgi:hypothetical protein
MPNTPTYMKKRAEKVEKAIGAPRAHSSREEKEKARKKAESEKDNVVGGKFGPWVLGLLIFVVIGSSFLQIITNIQTSPSMSVEH